MLVSPFCVVLNPLSRLTPEYVIFHPDNKFENGQAKFEHAH